jgi:hypothetical protein
MNPMTHDGGIRPEAEDMMMTCDSGTADTAMGNPGTPHPWTTHIAVMDRAVAEGNVTAAVRAWRQAYLLAVNDMGWHGLIDVASACRRIGAIPGFAKTSDDRARETYWLALFRARRQGSLEGVLQSAEAFGALGDRAMVEQCIRVAERLAALNSDGAAPARVRALAASLMQRYVDAGIRRADAS